MTKEEIEHEKLWTEGIVSAVMLSSKGIVRDFISNLEKVGYKIVKAESENERLKAEMEWISVETKLPKFDELVIWRGLVTWNSKNPIRIFSDEMTTDQETLEYGEQAYLLKNETDYVVCRNPNVQEFTDQFVTHWMPFPELPQPPKQ